MTNAQEEPWTIDRVRASLGSPLGEQFLEEIRSAPADKLLGVFARWRRAAVEMAAGVARARELAAEEARLHRGSDDEM